jgi:predicted kinase
MIVVFSGPPCSGKSLLGEMLARARAMTHLEMDAIRARLLPDAAHTRQDRVLAYRAMHLVAETLAARGEPVAVDASYAHAADRRGVEEVASITRTPLYLIECTVTPETAVRRCRARRQSHPGLDLTDERVAALVRTFPYFRKGLLIDGEAPAEDCLRRILDHLSSAPPIAPGPWSAAGQIDHAD